LVFSPPPSSPKTLTLAPACRVAQEKGGEPSSLPDLHFNRAVVYAYLGEYQHALEGFSMAGQLDPSLPWMAEVESILTTVLKLSELVHAKVRDELHEPPSSCIQ
jgi:hypothetical protein